MTLPTTPPKFAWLPNTLSIPLGLKIKICKLGKVFYSLDIDFLIKCDNFNNSDNLKKMVIYVIFRVWVFWESGWKRNTITKNCCFSSLTWCNLFLWNMWLCTLYTSKQFAVFIYRLVIENMISYSRVFCYLAGYKGYFVALWSDVAFYILVALKRLTSVLKGMNECWRWVVHGWHSRLFFLNLVLNILSKYVRHGSMTSTSSHLYDFWGKNRESNWRNCWVRGW